MARKMVMAAAAVTAFVPATAALAYGFGWLRGQSFIQHLTEARAAITRAALPPDLEAQIAPMSWVMAVPGIDNPADAIDQGYGLTRQVLTVGEGDTLAGLRLDLVSQSAKLDTDSSPCFQGLFSAQQLGENGAAWPQNRISWSGFFWADSARRPKNEMIFSYCRSVKVSRLTLPAGGRFCSIRRA